ncbi:hypothetical protein DSM106972_022120 [Dulcicalothrix desertica PCC 7102]|uniref:Uncharacterized protein n=1 Tax=Dulcicalothrix desertica PCC 7102 TaxID=232991 RepID=A0A3S1DDM6_9CYAN|nr:hypothetical protein DSM106972_022120 [Dulcicalothrix desertica PCC 7102]TWH39474.1 hypothetical protein CAL7102_08709 [Dulcicalothrix desertica PCC 7102]
MIALSRRTGAYRATLKAPAVRRAKIDIQIIIYVAKKIHFSKIGESNMRAIETNVTVTDVSLTKNVSY